MGKMIKSVPRVQVALRAETWRSNGIPDEVRLAQEDDVGGLSENQFITAGVPESVLVADPSRIPERQRDTE